MKQQIFDMKRIFLISTMLSLTIVTPAYAYVDPGSATIVLQILAAIGAGAFLMIRRIREFFASLFSRIRKVDASPQDKAK